MKLRYDNRAIADLDKIFNYISERDPRAATRVVARIRALSEQLLERPRIGRVTDIPRIRMRSVVKYPYVIFYTIKQDDIVILHVRHTARSEPDPSEVI